MRAIFVGVLPLSWAAEQCVGDSATLDPAQCTAWVELYDAPALCF